MGMPPLNDGCMGRGRGLWGCHPSMMGVWGGDVDYVDATPQRWVRGGTWITPQCHKSVLPTPPVGHRVYSD